MTSSLRAKAFTNPDTSRLAPGMPLPPPTGGRPTKTERPQRFPKVEQHPITIMSPTHSRSSTEISLGARAHDKPDRLTTRNHSPPTTRPLALDRRDHPQISDTGVSRRARGRVRVAHALRAERPRTRRRDPSAPLPRRRSRRSATQTRRGLPTEVCQRPSRRGRVVGRSLPVALPRRQPAGGGPRRQSASPPHL